MEIEELDGYIRENWDSIKEQIRERSYTPQPVRRVEIPKPNGMYGGVRGGLNSPYSIWVTFVV